MPVSSGTVFSGCFRHRGPNQITGCKRSLSIAPKPMLSRHSSRGGLIGLISWHDKFRIDRVNLINLTFSSATLLLEPCVFKLRQSPRPGCITFIVKRRGSGSQTVIPLIDFQLSTPSSEWANAAMLTNQSHASAW